MFGLFKTVYGSNGTIDTMLLGQYNNYDRATRTMRRIASKVEGERFANFEDAIGFSVPVTQSKRIVILFTVEKDA